MMEGFSRSTEFYVLEPDSDGNRYPVLKSFNDYNPGDNITIIDRFGEYVPATIKQHDIAQVMYKLIFSSKRFVEVSSNKIYDKFGKQFSEYGIAFGQLTNESTRNNRVYYGIGHAVPEKQYEALHSDDEYSLKRSGTISYSLYDLDENLIESGLTQKEVERLVTHLSRIDYTRIVDGLVSGEFIEINYDYSVTVTPTHTWFLYDNYKEKFLRQWQRLFDYRLYNKDDPKLSGFIWYLKDITIDEYVMEKPWTISSKQTNSFMLKNYIPTGK